MIPMTYGSDSETFRFAPRNNPSAFFVVARSRSDAPNGWQGTVATVSRRLDFAESLSGAVVFDAPYGVSRRRRGEDAKSARNGT
jgi:hypothetical protein